MRSAITSLYEFVKERRLVFPAILIFCNLLSAWQSFSARDYRRAVYWLSSAVCLLMVAV